MNPRVTVGLIGAGYWGSNLCRVLGQHPNVELSWVCDSDTKTLQRVERIAPKARLTTVADDLLNDSCLAGIVVATPVASHYSLASCALHAGKHVVVEKPLSRTVAEAERLIAEAEIRQRVLMVGHTFLYNGAVRRVKAMIDAGDLGEVRYIFMRRLNLGIVRQDVDALWSLAPHDLSILNYWIGRPVTGFQAIGHSYLRPTIADVVFAHLSYEDNIAGHIQVSWLDPNKVRTATVVGSRRMLVYDDMSPDQRIVVYDKGIDAHSLDASLGGFGTFAQHQVKVRAGDAWLPKVEFPEPLVEQIDEFTACITQQRTPLADGRNGLEVVNQLEQLTLALQRNGAHVS